MGNVIVTGGSRGIGLGKIVWCETNGAGGPPRGLIDGLAQLGGLFTRENHHAVGGFGQAASDAESDASASAGHDDVTHHCVPAFLSPRSLTREQS